MRSALLGLALVSTHTIAGQALLKIEDYYGKEATLMSSPCDGARDIYEGYTTGEDQRLKYLCWFPMGNGVYVIDMNTKAGTWVTPSTRSAKKTPRLEKLL